MEQTIAAAKSSVDISTLAPFPDGAFEDAIVKGLNSSVAAGHHLDVRILAGAAPAYHANVLPSQYRDKLLKKLGNAAQNIKMNVATMTTSRSGLSWNHSKLLIVDGQSVITGGVNDWKADYLETTHPVSDADLSLRGPAAGSATTYLNKLWGWTCGNSWNPMAVWLATSNDTPCMATLVNDAFDGADGEVSAIAVGGLGNGIMDVDPSSNYKPEFQSQTNARCTAGLTDHTNADRNYDTVNPEETALRSLVASATKRIDITQQDLNATCPPLPRYDIRFYDILAEKLAAGVKVRIVVSDPANLGTTGSAGYSQIKSLKEISDLISTRLQSLTGNSSEARSVMCQNLQLASFRSSDQATWADGKPYAVHYKIVSVDDVAFYMGSKNLYPTWLQDFGYVIENSAAGQQLKDELLDPEWRYSQKAATFDYAQGLCPR
ncbi:phospholipase D-like domain-containing protein [Streptomyces sp. NPDC055085]